MTIKKTLMSLLLAGSIVLGISVSGNIHNSYNGIPGANSLVKVYRKPTGPIDTLVTNANTNTRWTIFTENFNPPAQISDTLFVEAKKDTLGRQFYSTTKWIIRNGTYPYHNFVRELHLDDPWNSPLAFTPNISVVKDTSGISTSFVALAWLYKNPAQKCIGVVDTALSLSHRYDAYFNFENQDSTFSPGDSFKIRLQKTRNDTTWFTEIASAVDTTYFGAMTANASNSVHNGAFHGDTLYFPQGRQLGAIEEKQKQETKKGIEYKVYPSIAKDEVNVKGINGMIDLYDVSGKKIAELSVNNGKINLSGYSKGVYFVLPKKTDLPGKKIVKLD